MVVHPAEELSYVSITKAGCGLVQSVVQAIKEKLSNFQCTVSLRDAPHRFYSVVKVLQGLLPDDCSYTAMECLTSPDQVSCLKCPQPGQRLKVSYRTNRRDGIEMGMKAISLDGLHVHGLQFFVSEISHVEVFLDWASTRLNAGGSSPIELPSASVEIASGCACPCTDITQ